MDSPSDGVALSITILLCPLALKQSVDLPPKDFLSWVELSRSVNTPFQGTAHFLDFLD